MGNICSILLSKSGKCMEECTAWVEEAKIKNICKSRRNHLNFLLNFEGYFQVLAFYLDNICRPEYDVSEDLPEVADFCPKNQMEKDLEASTSTVCAGWAGTNDQAQLVIPLHLEWNPQWCILTLAEDGLKKHEITTVSEVLIQCFLSL